MINKQEIKERVQNLIDAGVEIKFVEFAYKKGVLGGTKHIATNACITEQEPKKPEALLIDANGTDEETIKSIENCEKQLADYFKKVELSGKTLVKFIENEFAKSDKSQKPLRRLPEVGAHLNSVSDSCEMNAKILGDSKSCTILPQHRNVIMIDCEELVSTESDCIWYKNEMIGKLSR